MRLDIHEVTNMQITKVRIEPHDSVRDAYWRTIIEVRVGDEVNTITLFSETELGAPNAKFRA